ncbi:hypothetical protein ANN_27779, partial [Periplaneta americana]
MKISGVPKIVSLHVYRLEPNTKAEQLVDFLKSSFPEMTYNLATNLPLRPLWVIPFEAHNFANQGDTRQMLDMHWVFGVAAVEDFRNE